jgi:K+/H+ antiporter YhaU regulatory subunit KhtT
MSTKIVCNICSSGFDNEAKYKRHLKTKRHIKNIEAIGNMGSINNNKDQLEEKTYTQNDLDKVKLPYEKRIEELKKQTRVLDIQLYSEQFEKKSLNCELKSIKCVIDANYRELERNKEQIDKYHDDLEATLQQNIELEKRVKERSCCFL